MGIFGLFKSKPKSNVKVEQKTFTLDNIKLLIDLTVCNEDAVKLKDFLDNKVRNHIENDLPLNENFEFNSQEIVDFMAGTPVYFYGYLDWKEHSKEFDFYIRTALKRNFESEFVNEKICDLNQLSTIDKVYKIYGEALEKQQVTLCNIDTGDDSYQVMLVKEHDYDKLFAPIGALGYRIEHFTEEW